MIIGNRQMPLESVTETKKQQSDLCVLRQTIIAAGELFVFDQVVLKEQKHCQSRGAAASHWDTEIISFWHSEEIINEASDGCRRNIFQ